MNLFLLHGKTCVQFWYKDLRIAASNSLSGHFETQVGETGESPNYFRRGLTYTQATPTVTVKDGKSYALVSCVYCVFFKIKAVFIIFINKNTFVGVNVFHEEILISREKS